MGNYLKIWLSACREGVEMQAACCELNSCDTYLLLSHQTCQNNLKWDYIQNKRECVHRTQMPPLPTNIYIYFLLNYDMTLNIV